MATVPSADKTSEQMLPLGARLKSDEIPALFWDEMPDDPDNPDMAAIQAIIDESTPEERANSYKVCIHIFCCHTISTPILSRTVN